MLNLEYLNNLNEAQNEAVSHIDGPLLIVAGAGSGKTKVLTSRIAHMIKQKKGVIILTSSGAGVLGGSSSYAYGSSKGGVHGLSLVMMDKLSQYGIRVHDILPGSVDTPLKNSQIETTRDITGNQDEYKNVKKS